MTAIYRYAKEDLVPEETIVEELPGNGEYKEILLDSNKINTLSNLANNAVDDETVLADVHDSINEQSSLESLKPTMGFINYLENRLYKGMERPEAISIESLGDNPGTNFKVSLEGKLTNLKDTIRKLINRIIEMIKKFIERIKNFVSTVIIARLKTKIKEAKVAEEEAKRKYNEDVINARTAGLHGRSNKDKTNSTTHSGNNTNTGGVNAPHTTSSGITTKEDEFTNNLIFSVFGDSGNVLTFSTIIKKMDIFINSRSVDVKVQATKNRNEVNEALIMYPTLLKLPIAYHTHELVVPNKESFLNYFFQSNKVNIKEEPIEYANHSDILDELMEKLEELRKVSDHELIAINVSLSIFKDTQDKIVDPDELKAKEIFIRKIVLMQGEIATAYTSNIAHIVKAVEEYMSASADYIKRINA